MRGKFITLEGVEGVGKTSNRSAIEAQLESAGINFITLREPGGTELGEKLRELLLFGKGSIQSETELMMMVASRIELVKGLIEPALAKGTWVLCDRYMDASIAYQGAGRSLGENRVKQLHNLMGITLQPDLTLLLDLPVETGRERMSCRGEPDRIESETLAFFDRVRDAYLSLASSEPDRIKVVDASVSLEQVTAQVGQITQAFIANAR